MSTKAKTKELTSLGEALVKAGVAPEPSEEAEILQPERVKRDWWQVFRCSLTKFEIPTVLVVKCDEVREGLEFIGQKALNSIEGQTWEDTYKSINVALATWKADYIPEDSNDNPPKGTLLHYKVHGKTWTPRNGNGS